MADEDDGRKSRLAELGGYIREQRKSTQQSLRELAKKAGVSNPYLSQIERGLRKPSAEILQAIAKALSISSETLYVKAGILEERDTDHDLEACVARDPHLTDPQRQAIIEMYRTFRRLSEVEQADEAEERGTVQRIVDAVGTGDVSDEDIAAATPDEEDAEEA